MEKVYKGKNKPKIQMLTSGFGNDAGDIVKIFMETDGELYYYDEFRRWCYIEKSLENIEWKWGQKPQ